LQAGNTPFDNAGLSDVDHEADRIAAERVKME